MSPGSQFSTFYRVWSVVFVVFGAQLAALPESQWFSRQLYDRATVKLTQPPSPSLAALLPSTEPVRQAGAEMLLDDGFAGRLVAQLRSRDYHLDTEPGELNIILVKGTNPDGTPNNNAPLPSRYNDLLVLVEFVGDRPQVRFAAAATTESNAEVPVHEDHLPFGGAAQITLGQHLEKWQLRSNMYLNRGGPFTGLMQIDELPIGFDENGNGRIDADEPVRQWLPGRDGGAFVFHPQLDYSGPGTASAGCIVPARDREFFEFIRHLQRSRQVRQNPDYRWTVTLLNGVE